MTIIVVKNRNFAAQNLLRYRPPIDDASVCAFLGDRSRYLQNFGTGDDLAEIGNTSQVDDVFRRVNLSAYIDTGVSRTSETTVVAVYRNVTGATGFGIICSSEREHADGGKRGVGFSRSNIDTSCGWYCFGTNAGAPSTLARTLPATTEPASFVVGFVKPTETTGASIAADRYTPPESAQPYASNMNATMEPALDEVDFPFLVGKNYRTGYGGDVDVGFLLIAPRILTTSELGAIYASVKLRFNAFGVTI